MSSSSLIDNPTAISNPDETPQRQQLQTETVESLYINDEEIEIHENFTKSKICISLLVLIVVIFVIVDFSTNRYIESFFTSVLEWIEANPIPGFIVSIIIYFVSTGEFIWNLFSLSNANY